VQQTTLNNNVLWVKLSFRKVQALGREKRGATYLYEITQNKIERLFKVSIHAI